MQSFLPYPDFAKSASVLDYRRLGKQRLECKQMLKALGYEIIDGKLQTCEARTTGWVNHPCTAMWNGYEDALAEYMMHIVLEWKDRGYNNTMDYLDPNTARIYQNPVWLGDEAIHASHRSKLMQKAPEHYRQFGWNDPTDMRYWWPIIQPNGTYTLEHRGNG